MTFRRNLKISEIIFTVLLSGLMFFSMVSPAFRVSASGDPGYKSWVDEDMFNDKLSLSTDYGAYATYETKEETSTTEKTIAEMIANIGVSFTKAVKGTGGNDIDATTLGIIMGNLAGKSKISYFKFDLQADNPYGTVSANIYKLLRTIMLTLLYIVALWSIVQTMWKSGQGKGLSELKADIYSIIIVIVLIFFMPQITDWLCHLRDYITVVMFKGMVTAGSAITDFSNGYEDLYYKTFTNHETLGAAVIFDLFCIIPLFFMVSYVKIALQQIILFGMFPVFAVAGVRNKSILSNWMAVFFSNIFIPAIDMVLITVPMYLITVVGHLLDATSSGNAKNNIIVAVIILTVQAGVIPARNQVLSLLGNAFGVVGGRGFGVIGAMGAAAARGVGALAMSRMGGSGSASGSSQSSKNTDTSLSADKDSLAKQQKNLGDIDGITADKNGSSAGGSASGGAGSRTGGETSSDAQAAPGADVPQVGGSQASNVGAVDSGRLDSAESSMPTESLSSAEGGGGAGGGVNSGGEAVSENGSLAYEGGGGAGGGASNADVLDDDTKAQISMAADSIYGDAKSAEGAKNDFEEFNLNRASNLAQMDSLQSQSDQMALQDAQDRAAINESKAAIQSNNEQLSELQAGKDDILSKRNDGSPDAEGKPVERAAMVGGQKMTLGEIDTKMAQLKADNKAEKGKISEATARMDRNAVAGQQMRSELSKRKGLEGQYAQASANAGLGSNQKFGSLAEYNQAMTHANNVRKAANYKNYNTENVKGVLSSREIERYRAQAMRRDAVRVAVGTAGTVVGAAAGATLGAAIGSVGGEATMQVGMQAGANIGSVIGRGGSAGAAKAASAVGSSRVAEKAREKLSSESSAPIPGTGAGSSAPPKKRASKRPPEQKPSGGGSSVRKAVEKATSGPASGGTGAGKNAQARSSQTGRNANLSSEEQHLRDSQQKFVDEQRRREQERNAEFENKANRVKP